MIALSLPALSLLALSLSAATVARAEATPNIRVIDFNMTRLDAGKVRFAMTAAGEGGMEVGSFLLYVNDVLPGHELPPLPGFVHAYDRLYVRGEDFGASYEGRLQKDNGKLDEDPRDGAFALTLDTSDWPAGRYYLTMVACNAPLSAGNYIASRITSLDVGRPELRDEAENVAGARHTVVWRDEDVYACFPSLLHLPDGRLVTRFGTKTRSSHIDPTGGSRQMVSADGGRSWAVSDESFQDPDERAGDGRLVRARAEGWVYTEAADKERLKRERFHTMDSTPGRVAYLSRKAFAETSADGGKTWERTRITVPDDVLGMLTFHALRTSTGLRLVSVYGPRATADGKSTGECYFLRSEDDGRTWQFVYHTPGGKPDPKLTINETTLHELPNGQLLAMHRTADTTNLYRSFSTDGGRTWSPPEDTGIWGYPPELVNLPDGRVLCVYGYRRAPMGIRACVSRDNGRTWDVDDELILRADGLAAGVGDLGYPKITRLADGTLFTIYYIATDGRMPFIATTHFPVPAAAGATPATRPAGAAAGTAAGGRLTSTTARVQPRGMAPRDASPSAAAIRIVAFGDSITKGARAANKRMPAVREDETFLARVGAALEADGIDVETVNAGVGGNNSDQGLARLDADVLAARPDVVLVMFGANDAVYEAGATEPRVTPDRFEANLRSIVERVRAAGATPILMTTPPLGTHWAAPPHPAYEGGKNNNVILPKYADATRRVARELRVPLVDHWAHWSDQPQATIDAWEPDGVHPTGEGHRVLTDLILPVLRDEVKAIRGRRNP